MNLVSEPNDPMGDNDLVLTQLVLLMEQVKNIGNDVKSLKLTVAEHGATLETLNSTQGNERAHTMENCVGVYTEEGSLIK